MASIYQPPQPPQMPPAPPAKRKSRLWLWLLLGGGAFFLFIVASVETVGASGGYYVACATDKIYADRGSIVGSIGVISQWVNYGDFLKWAKLKDVTFKAGALKDTGNPAREMTPEEKQYFQSLLDDMHGQFIAAVAN